MNNLYKRFIITDINLNVCSIPSRNTGANIAISFSLKAIFGIAQLKSNAESVKTSMRLKA